MQERCWRPGTFKPKRKPPTCVAENCALSGSGEFQEPMRADARTFLPGPAPPELSSGEDLGGAGKKGQSAPPTSVVLAERQTRSKSTSADLGGTGPPPPTRLAGPNAKGQRMNEPQIRPSLAGQGGPRERSPVGILEGFSESAPRQGFQGWRTSATTSSSCCVFTVHHPIFGPSRARAGSCTPAARQRRTSRESRGPLVRPGSRTAGGSRRRSVRGGPTGSNASGAESNGGNSAVCEAQDGGRRGRLIASPRGRRRGGLRPGYWPPADPPRRCVHRAVALARLPQPHVWDCLLHSDLFKETSAATCGGSRRASGWYQEACSSVWEWA